ncbi:2-oxo acid dehydrogenase subunit E2 [Halopseudomonas bauzanensis]|uniref:Dihydrolipoamide acetyltransferase component of pyruvate dehydrogenase complex n=1 Tax=Halopseudomonas bauzanensis TaxID=653930 RepID=A0A4U0YLP3_9GAMM|nr:2-oxo acid dehydrogenase subunit E2 [Halopseudomonas bauzanensis]TKA92228.1 2-oxo acid dehydrogenase subunit E2 [Halopseudomonas bauzanensis]
MSDIRPIEVPKWGLTMEEGTLSTWLLQEGQAFSKGDELCEIETSKIANALEASFDGVLRRILVEPGTTLPVGALLAIAAPESVNDEAIEVYLASRQSGLAAPAQSPPVAEVPLKPVPAPATSVSVSEVSRAATSGVPEQLRGETATSVLATPHAWRLAQREGIDLAKVSGSGREGRISVEDIVQAVSAAGGSLPQRERSVSPTAPGDDSQVAATPIARRLAVARGVDLRDCRATGSRGRVCRADVEALLAMRQGDMPAAAESPAAGVGVIEQPLSAMRRTIAARLQASKQSAPHYRVSMDLDLEALLSLRDTLNGAVPDLKISVNDMLVKASAQALMAVPELNVQYDAERQVIRQLVEADIAVAVAIDGGLITPIVPAANRKTLGEISTLVRDLATRAKAGTLKPVQFQGGSFSISNLGMHGVKQFDAIINPPQVAILAVGAASEQVVVRDGQMVIRRQLTASLSSDHRVVDGALAASFMNELKRLVETPALLMV